MIPAAHGIAAHASIPHSRLELFEGAGHYPFDEDPERFAAVLRTSWRDRAPGYDEDEIRRRAARGGAGVNLPDELVPGLRGVSHAWAFWFALVAGAVLALYAPTGLARAAALVYGVGLCALFAASGLYHRWRWNPRWRPLLRRIDHSTIFIFIAASYTPVALLVLRAGADRRARQRLGGALAGVALSVAWITRPAGSWPPATSRSAGWR